MPHANEKPQKDGNTAKIVAAVAVLLIAIAIWRAVESDAVTRMIARIGDRRQTLQQETTAPGASELGKMGCGQVMIMSPEIRVKLQSQRHRKTKGIQPPPEATVVICIAKLFNAPPDCDTLARAYVAAAHPSAPFRIAVNKPGASEGACSRDYDSSGQADIADAESR